MRRPMFCQFVAILCLMLLIFDSKCAFEGAKTGLDLCMKTVIPSLFPFFVVSMLLTASLGNMDFKLLCWLADLLNIPQAAAPILVPAFLGGYPVGAKSVADQYRNGIIEKQEAERLLAFCSNAGPSFLFGMVAAYFSDKQVVWQLWIIHILGAVFTAKIYPSPLLNDKKLEKVHHAKPQKELMRSAVTAMGIVCGWIIVFRILITFLKKWLLWLFPQWMQVLAIGILELSNGCCELMQVPDVSLRFVLCSCLLAFGGVCVLLQTCSVAEGLSLRHYLIGKMIQTLFSLVVSAIVSIKPEFLYLFIMVFLMGIPVKGKNRGRNPKLYPV